MHDSPPPPARQTLGLADAVSMIVGIVIGATIFEAAPVVLSSTSSPGAALGVWVLGGTLSLCGALCYAELATTFPQTGGDYVYLKRAYGPALGFLFGWTQLLVVLTASIGAMAFVFADYAVRLAGAPSVSEHTSAPGLAMAAVALLSLLNIFSAKLGKNMQNVLTVAKIVGLAAIICVGLGWGRPVAWTESVPAATSTNAALAMIIVLYTYGGWNDAAFVAAEVSEPQKNIPRALVLGIACITLTYVLVNAAYISGLGFAAAGASKAVAADTLAIAWGPIGAKAMCLVVMLSALGACNGLIFTCSRVYARLGAEHRVFAPLGRWHPRLGTPAWSLAVQALVCIAMIAVVTTAGGQGLVNRGLSVLRLPPASWQGHGGFETLVTCSAPLFWAFFLLTGSTLFVLRYRAADVPRPFRVPLYPLLPLIFCGTSAWMLYGSLSHLAHVRLLGAFVLLAVVPVALAIPLYFVGKLDRWCSGR